MRYRPKNIQHWPGNACPYPHEFYDHRQCGVDKELRDGFGTLELPGEAKAILSETDVLMWAMKV